MKSHSKREQRKSLVKVKNYEELAFKFFITACLSTPGRTIHLSPAETSPIPPQGSIILIFSQHEKFLILQVLLFRVK